ncbi:TAT-variant-translocated molybdopterin oxidoreductase [Caenispirillum bisanense]|uniref:Prokaryotic molybdopterin-containing oxidoreductase family, iron-sulfur binding subunit n=1 Tax=Caenispirillum bisanense TaxID=414052 RepID=A0A286G0G6_9PROT|nr:TAT-variant-translocated molybdopterin oxidoreductase [Caenispirillum bisanense]SOD88932.1 prokaryotic molybdopterin-containing oxidoreductase family, iron-sulfur binding subunit [Caenispirillum bisanense]
MTDGSPQRRGRDLWLSLEQRTDPEAVAALVEQEFGVSARQVLESDRRTFLKCMAASFSLAGLAGCDWEAPEEIEMRGRGGSWVQTDERRFYATSVVRSGWAVPVLAEAVGGRPLRLDGNAEHPAGTTAIDAHAQAEVLRLYDPDRSRAVRHFDTPVGAKRLERELADIRRWLAESGGEGVALLTGPTTSPMVGALLREITERHPQARWYTLDPLPATAPPRLPRFDRAEVIVSLAADFLGPGATQVPFSAAFAARRREHGAQALFVAEPTPTLTGLRAGPDRLPQEAARLPALAAALLARAEDRPLPDGLSEAERTWVDRAWGALEAAPGRGMVLAGDHEPEVLHALATHLNHRTGNAANVQVFDGPLFEVPQPAEQVGLRDLLARDDVSTLVVLDSDPVYHAPGDLDVAGWLQTVPRIVHAGLYVDETGKRSQWHIPLAHPLEVWNDGRAIDGTYTLRQPLLRPIFAGWSEAEVLKALLVPLAEAAPDRELLRASWQAVTGQEGEDAFRAAIAAGFVPDTAPPLVDQPQPPAVADPDALAVAPVEDGLEVVFRPDAALWDGSFANCAWMLEWPKPLTKVTWDTALLVSPQLAAERGLRDGDVVALGTAAGGVTAPVIVHPGQAARSVTVELGGGRDYYGSLSRDVGYDGFRIRPADALWRAPATVFQKTDGRRPFARTQLDGMMREEEPIRVVAAAEQDAAPEQHPTVQAPTLYPKWMEKAEHAWAMVIDLDLCTGCSACVTACQAENNIPVVGRDQVEAGRAMHWLRVDRYWEDAPEQPLGHFQPRPCMHCEKAPCELGCPVNATVHGPEGLNQMVYNRCIGTRTCASFCPYKVRRFNFFDYTSGDANEAARPQRNPEVTVRSRGVMEKCTYCVQRIERAKITAEIEGREVEDADVTTACASACPTRAIRFGDKRRDDSDIARLRRDPRHYALLHELATQPRTTYLAKVEPGAAHDEEDEHG